MTGRSAIGMSIMVGPDAEVSCAGYADDAPILSIHATGINVGICNRDRFHSTCADVAFAESLAREAARFASETARSHADHYAGPCTCASRAASTQPGASAPA